MENNELIKYEARLVKKVGDVIRITNKLVSVNSRAIKILHLDDHSLFSKGFLTCVLRNFPNAVVKNIQDGNIALEYVTWCLENNELIDVIVTDISHPGLDGISFSKAVRAKEMNFDKKIPILFLTMHNNENALQKIKEIPFAKYLTKNSTCEKINSVITDVII